MREQDGTAPGPGTGDAQPERALVEGYLRGDAEIFREVDGWIRVQISTKYPVLRREIEDVGQEVHGKLVANLRAGRFGSRSSFKTYVIAVAHHSAIDRIRRLYRDRALSREWLDSNADRSESPYRSLVRLEEEERLFLAAQSAPAACKELWRMALLEKLSYEEIGRRLSVPPGTVKSRMWYCRRKVLALFEALPSVRGRRRPPQGG
jgi:RNA polymerase sigma-70 factor (ECF subfamily)